MWDFVYRKSDNRCLGRFVKVEGKPNQTYIFILGTLSSETPFGELVATAFNLVYIRSAPEELDEFGRKSGHIAPDIWDDASHGFL